MSLLVLASVMATARTRHIYDATILHSLDARYLLHRLRLNPALLLRSGG